MMSRRFRFGALALILWVGAPAVSFAQVTDAQRIDRLEALVRTLTGQIEELTFRVQQLEQSLQVMRDDNEFRFQQLGDAAAAPGAVVQPQTQAAPPLQLDLGAPPAALGQVPATPPGVPAANNAAGVGEPLDLGLAIRGDPGQPAAAAATVAMTGDPEADYNRAYQRILDGDYALAEASFRSFMTSYPGNARSADAQYWVAESLFSREAYREAVPEFLSAYRANPSSDLAPASLYKLGLSYLALNEVQGACDSFAQILRQYPNASNALRQSVAAAQANARCA